MIEQQMEKKGESAQKLRDAWEKDPNLFDRMRERVMSSPVFDREAAHEIDSSLQADTAKFDNAIRRIERAEAQAKAQNAPEKQNQPQVQQAQAPQQAQPKQQPAGPKV